MRRAAKVDANQKEIVDALRSAGASVVSTASMADGFPDLVVGFRGENYLLEVKDGNKPPSKQRLTADQEVFFSSWKGSAQVVRDPQEALAAIGAGFVSDG